MKSDDLYDLSKKCSEADFLPLLKSMGATEFYTRFGARSGVGLDWIQAGAARDWNLKRRKKKRSLIVQFQSKAGPFAPEAPQETQEDVKQELKAAKNELAAAQEAAANPGLSAEMAKDIQESLQLIAEHIVSISERLAVLEKAQGLSSKPAARAPKP